MQEGCPVDAVVRATPIQRDGRGLRIGFLGNMKKSAVSASTPTLVCRAYRNGRVASSNTGVQAAASVRETRRRNVVAGGNASDRTARFLKGRHAGHCKAFGNHMGHVRSGQTGGRFGEEREGIRMLQEQLVMLWPCAGQARGASSLGLAKRPRSRTGSPSRAGWNCCNSAGTGSRAIGGLFDASVNAARVAALPGANSAAVGRRLARDSSPRRTLAHAISRQCAAAASASWGSARPCGEGRVARASANKDCHCPCSWARTRCSRARRPAAPRSLVRASCMRGVRKHSCHAWARRSSSGEPTFASRSVARLHSSARCTQEDRDVLQRGDGMAQLIRKVHVIQGFQM